MPILKRVVGVLAGSTGDRGLFADASEWGHGIEFFRPLVHALEFVNAGDKTAIELVAVKVRRSL